MKSLKKYLSNVLFLGLFLVAIGAILGQSGYLSADGSLLNLEPSAPLTTDQSSEAETVPDVEHRQTIAQIDTMLIGEVELTWGATGTLSDTWTAEQLSPLTEQTTIDLAFLLEPAAGEAVTAYVELQNTLVFTTQHVISTTVSSGNIATITVGPQSTGSYAGNQLNLLSERIAYTTESGQTVERQFQLRAEPNPENDLLQGEYRETVWWVTFEPLTIIGTFVLQETDGVLPVSSVGAPQAFVDSATVSPGGSVAIDILGNDSAINGQLDRATVTIVQQPTQGTVSVNSTTGVVTYQADVASSGDDIFTYTVKDTNGLNSAEAAVLITIAEPVEIDNTLYLPLISFDP